MINHCLNKAPYCAPSRVEACAGCKAPVTATEPDDGGGVLCKACVEELHKHCLIGLTDKIRRRLHTKAMEVKQSQ